MNQWVFTGNLTRDPEVRVVGDTEVVTFTVAVNVGFGDRASTLFPRVNVWGKLGNGMKRATKGTRVVIAGELSMSEYTKRDGSKASSLEVRADRAEFASPAALGGNNGVPVNPSAQQPAPGFTPARTVPVNATEDEDENDLPF